MAKVILMLKHWVKLRRYTLFGYLAACHRVARVLCAVQSETQSHSAAEGIKHKPHLSKLNLIFYH
jgi:hypothetical protein